MTTLFVKITNQMIINCKKQLAREGSLWSQPRPKAIELLRTCINVNEQYQANYQALKVLKTQQAVVCADMCLVRATNRLASRSTCRKLPFLASLTCFAGA